MVATASQSSASPEKKKKKFSKADKSELASLPRNHLVIIRHGYLKASITIHTYIHIYIHTYIYAVKQSIISLEYSRVGRMRHSAKMEETKREKVSTCMYVCI